MKKKLKILVLSYLFPNSVHKEFGIFVLNRLKALSGSCEIIVINPIPWFPFSGKLKRYQNFKNIPKTDTKFGIKIYHPRFLIIPKYFKWVDSLSYFIAALPVALKIEKHFKFDLIDLHWTYPDILSGKLFSLIFKRKWLVTIRGMRALNIYFDLSKNKFFEEVSFRQAILKKFLTESDKVITLSQELRQTCIALGVEPEKIKIISNGVDATCFYYIDKSSAREQLCLPHRGKMLLTVGNLTHGKGVDRVLNGLKKLQKKHGPIIYYIAGSAGAAGDYTRELKKKIVSLGLKDDVVFLGQINHTQLVYWYNAADIFCLPSRSEGCPNVLMEALSCGCPSVSTNVGMVSEILVQNEMGQLSENNGNEFIHALDTALSNSYDPKHIAKHMEIYTWDQCSRRILREYKSLVKTT